MPATRKGFAHERHGPLKVAITACALAGFALAYAGFANAHGPGVDAITAPPSPPASRPPASSTPSPAPETSTPSSAKPDPTRQPRTSRGS